MLSSKRLALFSKAYRWRQFEETILSVGDVPFSRQDLLDKLGVNHTNAAIDLDRVLKRHDVTSYQGILRVPMMDWARLRGVGEAKLRLLIELLIYGGIETHRIDGWVNGAMHGKKLRQWSAVCREAQKKVRRGGKQG